MAWWTVWCLFMGRRCFVFFFLGSMLVYLCKSHTNYVSKFCGGGWSVVKDGYSMFKVWLSQSHCSLSMVMVVIYAPMWLKIRAGYWCFCIVGFVVHMSLTEL
jgi:hypothetical protein